MSRPVRNVTRDRGFTLIELLIVIIILAILAAIVIFAVGNTGKSSAEAACKSDAKSVETALEAYRAQNNNSFPDLLNWTELLGTAALPLTHYLRDQPRSTHYTIFYDANGQVLV